MAPAKMGCAYKEMCCLYSRMC